LKNTKTCPKCENNKIIRIKVFSQGTSVPAGFLNGIVTLSRYICCNCGYVEEWIDSKEDIRRLEEKYNK